MTHIEGNNTQNQGLCLVCAKELGLKPVDDLMKRFGINDDELELLSDQLMNGELGFSANDTPDFERGGSPVFPNLFMGGGPGGEKFQKNGPLPKGKREKSKEAP